MIQKKKREGNWKEPYSNRSREQIELGNKQIDIVQEYIYSLYFTKPKLMIRWLEALGEC